MFGTVNKMVGGVEGGLVVDELTGDPGAEDSKEDIETLVFV